MNGNLLQYATAALSSAFVPTSQPTSWCTATRINDRPYQVLRGVAASIVQNFFPTCQEPSFLYPAYTQKKHHTPQSFLALPWSAGPNYGTMLAKILLPNQITKLSMRVIHLPPNHLTQGTHIAFLAVDRSFHDKDCSKPSHMEGLEGPNPSNNLPVGRFKSTQSGIGGVDDWSVVLPAHPHVNPPNFFQDFLWFKVLLNP